LPFDPVAAIAALAPWDVIYPFDNRVHPAKHKMWVCLSRSDLWFLRINSLAYGGQCVPLTAARHPFLTHDSHVGCGVDLISVAEPELELLLGQQRNPARQGIVGVIDAGSRPTICGALQASRLLSPYQLRRISQELGCT
jgi:hypothetical protein